MKTALVKYQVGRCRGIVPVDFEGEFNIVSIITEVKKVLKSRFNDSPKLENTKFGTIEIYDVEPETDVL